MVRATRPKALAEMHMLKLWNRVVHGQLDGQSIVGVPTMATKHRS